MENKSGITLIALIITIIVMLILVAVSVQILIKSDLIGTTESAAEKYKTAHEEEENLNDVTINGKKLDEYKKKLEGNGDEGNLPTITAGQRATKNSEYTDGTNTAVIPAGFTVSGLATEKTIDGGLVIYLIPEGTTVDWTNGTAVANAQQTYDQFVWIPIKNTTDANAQDINDMYICQGKTANNGLCTITVENGIAKCTNTNHSSIVEGTEINKNTLMAGRLYANDIYESFEDAYTETYTSGSGLREPDTVPDHDNEDEYLEILSDILEPDAEEKEYTSEANFKEKLQEEYNEVVKSVYENKGFYVGRYETSNITTTDGTTITVQAGKTPSKEINWYYMYAQQKDYATNNNLRVGSTMIQGAAYDQVMKFVDTDDYNVEEVGNARNNFSKVYNTGSESTDQSKNIYDLEGNIPACTTEAYNTYDRIRRGGGYGWFGGVSASYREVVSPSSSNFYIGSLCQLYVK